MTDQAPPSPANDQDDAEPTLKTLNANWVRVEKRLANVEQVLLHIQATMTPRWLRFTGWGAFVGACLKVVLDQ